MDVDRAVVKVNTIPFNTLSSAGEWSGKTDKCLASTYWIGSTTICLLFIKQSTYLVFNHYLMYIHYTPCIWGPYKNIVKVPVRCLSTHIHFYQATESAPAGSWQRAAPQHDSQEIQILQNCLLTLHIAELFSGTCWKKHTSFIMLHIIITLSQFFWIWMKSFFRGVTNLCHDGPSLRRTWKMDMLCLRLRDTTHGENNYTEALTSSGALPFSSDEGSKKRFWWREQVEHHQWEAMYVGKLLHVPDFQYTTYVNVNLCLCHIT